ncbi:hypothetical protein PWT90_11018 [Aphanocladium album]|nr:hypothetical protein PWT90_11018 [Aphanocladium album]
MTGPASPSTEGPTFAPPQLPPGWIAQWDSSSKKYYYVQLATGVSQWEIPTEAAKTGSTPAQQEDHPYGVPPPEIITHPDGSQTVKHADGRMEPIMADGSRGMGDGPSGDRGFGVPSLFQSMAMNALMGGKQGSGGGGSGNSALGSLANQFLGGGGSGGGGKSSSGIGGKLVGQLASNLFSPSEKPEAPSNYHGGQNHNAPSHGQGGLAGAVMGGVASMFGGQQGSGNQNFGYSNTGTGGTYSSSSPAPTYNPPGSNHNTPSSLQSSGSNHGSQTTHGSASQSQSFSEKPSQQSSQYSDNSYSHSQQPSYGSQSQHGSQQSYGGDHSYSQGGQGHSYSGSHGGQQHGGQQHGGQQYGGQQQHGGQQHGGQQYGGGGGSGYNSGNQYGGGGYQNQGQGYGGGGRY